MCKPQKGKYESIGVACVATVYKLGSKDVLLVQGMQGLQWWHSGMAAVSLDAGRSGSERPTCMDVVSGPSIVELGSAPV